MKKGGEVIRKLMIFLTIFAKIYALEIDQEYVEKNWTDLEEKLSKMSLIQMRDNDLTEESLIKIFSLELPKLRKLNFTN